MPFAKRLLPFPAGVCVRASLLLLLGGCADKFILHPSTYKVEPPDSQRRILDPEKSHIEVFVARSPGALRREPVAYDLEFCGNASRAEYVAGYVASRWRDHPVEVWVMNYPGFGQSAGPATLRNAVNASLSTYDILKKTVGDRPIFLSGNSLGTAAALCVAARRPCAGMILQNPPPLQSLILGNYGWWNLWLLAFPVSLQVPSELNSLRNAPKVHAPAIFLCSGEDTVVPPKYQNKVVQAYAGDKSVIERPNTSHVDHISREDEIAIEREIDRMWTSTMGPTTKP